jgi:hypothetical protein
MYTEDKIIAAIMEVRTVVTKLYAQTYGDSPNLFTVDLNDDGKVEKADIARGE